MRRAFTLIELLAVIGIMGMLGVAAAASYGALVNGMKERSACAAASAILREAGERARIDRLPTVVYCYNVCLKEPDLLAEDPGIVVGVMTAIRRVGRITMVKGPLLFDEFADLEVSYKTTDDEDEFKKMSGHRLFKFNDESSVQSRMQYSVVADDIYYDDSGESVGDEIIFSGCIGGRTNVISGAFYNFGTSNREPSGGWKVGDGYATEFAELQLPDGFIFGQQLPVKEGAISEIKAIRFDPDSFSSETIEIYSTRQNSTGRLQIKGRVGRAYADEKQSV